MRLGQEQIGFFVLHAEGVHEVICSELRLAHRSEVIRTVDITSCESRSPGADRSHLLLFTLARPPALDDGLCAMDVDRPCCRFNGLFGLCRRWAGLQISNRLAFRLRGASSHRKWGK